MANSMPMNRERESSSDETCVFETPGTSGTAFGGGGDHIIPRPRIKSFCNGVKVPVFEAEDTEIPEPYSNESSGNFPGIEFNQLKKIMEFFQCLICMGYLVEATAASCGHIFCSSCLNQSTNMKPICPVCSKTVNCRIRLFNLDLFLQNIFEHYGDFPEAFQKTMKKEGHVARKSIFLNIRESLDTLSIKCKGFLTTLANSAPTTSIQRHASQLRDNAGWLSTKLFVDYRFWIGCIVGAFIFWICTKLVTSNNGDGEQVNFLYYLYLCVTRYDGRIPRDFLKSPPVLNKTNGDVNYSANSSWWTKCFTYIGFY